MSREAQVERLIEQIGLDRTERLVELLKEGRSDADVAGEVEMSRSAVQKWKSRLGEYDFRYEVHQNVMDLATGKVWAFEGRR
jgi:hypothetical protein